MSDLPFFFLPPSALDLGAALRVVFSLGMMWVDVLELGVSWQLSREQLFGGRTKEKGAMGN